MLNKVFLEGIIAEKPMVQTAINGNKFILLLVICKPEQRRITQKQPCVMLYPDDIIPVMVFQKSYINWLSTYRNVGDVVQIEGALKTPKRKVVVVSQKIKLIKSAEYKAIERKVMREVERIRNNNEHSNS